VKPPGLIVVGPYRYRVSVDAKAFVDPDDTRVLGETRTTKLTIAIRPGLPPDLERVVVWHEVMHAVMSLRGWLGASKLPDEEEVVDHISQVQVEVLRSNPRLVRYLAAV
jgi:hypothetical protein